MKTFPKTQSGGKDNGGLEETYRLKYGRHMASCCGYWYLLLNIDSY